MSLGIAFERLSVVEEQITVLFSRKEGASLVLISGGFNPPVGTLVGMTGHPRDDAGGSAILVERTGRLGGVGIIGAIGGGEIPTIGHLGARVLRHIVGDGRFSPTDF